MGFGLLFIGFFVAFLMSINNYGFVFEIVGYAIMLSAIGKLSEYKHSLSRSVLPLFLMALCSAFNGIKKLCEIVSLELALFSQSSAFVVSILSAIFKIVFLTMLLLSIREITKDVEEPELAQKAISSLVISAFAFVLELLVAILGSFPSISDAQPFVIFALIATLIRILYPIFLLFFFYRCYSMICAPEDLDMAPRPSRFTFINRWRERQASREKEVDSLREDYRRKLEEKQKSKADAKKKNNKK